MKTMIIILNGCASFLFSKYLAFDFVLFYI